MGSCWHFSFLQINETNYPPFYYKNVGNFDFFNYAGIHRGVFLYSTEKTFISDVLVNTVKANETGEMEDTLLTASQCTAVLRIVEASISQSLTRNKYTSPSPHLDDEEDSVF